MAEKKVKTAEDMAAKAAVEACLATEGVASMVRLTQDYIKENILGNEDWFNGVKLSRQGGSLIIDVFVDVCYGCTIPQTAWSIQENVKKSVEISTDFNVKKVNIHIEGVKNEI